ncbi:MAG TPA: alpha-L-arabinofuranosidase C-terminal domain-containing protein [Clostridia bacterium]|nr:alpha-L-arabinofuranosidase C-terminal domain-containing protein [Clostridia bacterium]
MIRFVVCLVITVLLAVSSAFAGTGTVTVDTKKRGPRIPSSLYGIFLEEISHAGEGGLYGELIQNRGFEESNLPPACHLEGNVLVPPRTPHFWTQPKIGDWTMPWEVVGKWPAWSLQTAGGSAAALDLVDISPLNDATPHSLQVNITDVAEHGRVAVVNEGFWGIAVKDGQDYKLKFYARADQEFRGSITASLESSTGKVLATKVFKRVRGQSWQKYEATLKATGSDPKAQFVLTFNSKGKVWLDFVSLFPGRTFKNRPNGLRPDIAETIAALKPAFIRWPGGCFLEGLTVESRPQWKTMLGPVETRPGTYSPWGYWSSDGLGYHEFLQFSEDVGADALFVANVGVSCAFRSGTYLPDEQMPELIQDTLDAIEYAIGPVDSKWGSVRAKNGHPKPFPLKYVEVGNEQQGARYGERVAKFYEVIKAKYPQISIALSSWIAGIDRAAINAAGKIDIVDEHAYKPLHWPVENFDSFAKYKREGWDLYIGEFATNGGVGRGNLLAALNDSAYMMSMEKNSDLVKMGSYAPLLENVNKPNWEVNLIHFDSSRVYGRASYHAAKLFAENRPDVNLATSVEYQSSVTKPITGRIGVGTFDTSAEFRNIRVEKNGQLAFQSDFSKGAEGWTAKDGSWIAENGAYRQKDRATAWSYFGDKDWSDITLSLQARKVAGAEGFAVSVGYADDRRVQWNVGGWGNRQYAIQAGTGVIGKVHKGSVEEGRWYDLKVEVKGRTVRCYLDGQLVNEETLPRVDTVLAIAGMDEASGDIVVKVVNTSAEAASMTINLDGQPRISPGSEITVLTSSNPKDENSFESPEKIVPVTKKMTEAGAKFTNEFPPYSLSIIRLKTSK